MAVRSIVRDRERSGLDPVWKALSSPVRREILDLLREAPRTTGGLVTAIKSGQRLDRLLATLRRTARPPG